MQTHADRHLHSKQESSVLLLVKGVKPVAHRPYARLFFQSSTAEIELKKGNITRFTLDKSYKENLCIDNGLICLKVKEISEGEINVSLPVADLDLPAVSNRDAQNLRLDCSKASIWSLLPSSTRPPTCMPLFRSSETKAKASCKLENVDYLCHYTFCGFGQTMVACGKLGIEIPAQKVFVSQKMVIGYCKKAGKPVICATQVMQTMHKGRTLRCQGAYSSDTANIQVMLSPQTHIHEISQEAEAAVFHRQLFEELRRNTCLTQDPSEVVAVGAVESFKCCTKLFSKYAPHATITVVTQHAQTAQQLHLHHGVFPTKYLASQLAVAGMNANPRFAFIGTARGLFKARDAVLVVSGWCPGSGYTNIMRLVPVP
uniref:Pyruvate kinase n=1 Tax=Scleropages formosus TaxID=113540 RepID=A0A8C9R1T5_SCLFO